MASNCICLTDRDGVLHPRRDCPVHGEKKHHLLAAGVGALVVLTLFLGLSLRSWSPAPAVPAATVPAPSAGLPTPIQ